MVGLATEVNNSRGFSIVWNTFGEGSGTDTIVFPKFTRNYSQYNGGIQIQNVGDQATTIIATFSGCAGDVTVQSPAPVAPGASVFWFATAVAGLCDNLNGSVVVTNDNGAGGSEPIVGVYTERNDDTTKGDTYTAYTGMNK